MSDLTPEPNDAQKHASKSPWRFVKPTNYLCLALSVIATGECALVLHANDYPWVEASLWVAGVLALWFPFNWLLLYGSKWIVDAKWFARWKEKLNDKDPTFTDWLVVGHFAFLQSALPLGLIVSAPLLFLLP